MNFKKLMPLTLLSVAIFAANAFAQDTQPGIITVTSGGMGGGSKYPITVGGANGGGLGYGSGGSLGGTTTNFGIPTTLDKSFPYSTNLGDKWSPTVRRAPTLKGPGGAYYDNFMALPGMQQKDLNCPIYSLTCFDNSLPKTYSLQNTSNDFEKYFQTKKAFDCGYGPENINLDTLSDTLDKVNLPACYQNSDLADTDIDEERKDFVLLNRDKKVCDCLAEKANIVDPKAEGVVKILKGGRNQTVKGGDGADTPAYLQVLQENVAEVRDRIDRTTKGLSFQASVIGGANPNFTVAFSIPAGQLSYAQPSADSTSINASAAGIVTTAKGSGLTQAVLNTIGDVRNRNMRGFEDRATSLSLQAGNLTKPEILSTGLSSVSAPDLTTNVSASVPATVVSANPAKEKSLGSVLAGIEKPATIEPALLAGEKLTGEHCVGAREFMAFKQMPDNALVQNELRDPSKMTADNWNFKLLRARYDKIMAMGKSRKRGHKDEVLLLKAKLQFLERNPMFKTFLAADPSDLDKYYEVKGIKPDDQAGKDKVVAVYDKVKERKAELMAMVAKLTPPAGCDSAECMFKMSQSAEMQAVKASVKNFFANPLNAQLTQTENDKTGLLEAANFLNNPKQAFVARPKNYTVASVENAFARTYGLGKPSECATKKDMSLDTCFRIYAAWCEEIKEKEDMIKEQARQDPALIDDLDDSMKDYFETDPNKNPEFADFSKSVCETKRRKSANAAPESYRSFAEYSKARCASDKSLCDSNEKMENLRIAYLNEYKEPMVGNERGNFSILAFNAFIKNGRVKNMSQSDAQNLIANRTNSFSMDSFNKLNEEWGFEDNVVASSSKVANNTSTAVSGASESSTSSSKTDTKTADTSTSLPEETPSMGGAQFNYAGASTNNAVAANDQAPKVENMTDPQRQELMDDWQKEYDTWKKNKAANDGSPAANATDAAMQARIQALEQLLAQQKKLTEDQYKLLNDAIANQNKGGNNAVAANEGSSSSSSSNGRNRSTSAITGSSDDEDSSVSRGPASIANVPQNTSGSKSGAGSAGVGSGSSSSRRVSVNGSSDDIAREEAKLVNVRGNSDGSIVISAVSNNSGAGANAISVPVSDDQYRALQANPQSLNLSQIEKNIPKDQIAKLEKDGEIVIILRNGSNPPFEVKVEKKNNKLVYSLKDKNGKDQAPVRRVFTRQALELQLKANR